MDLYHHSHVFLHGVHTDGFAVIIKKFHSFVESEMSITVLTRTADIFECGPSHHPNFLLSNFSPISFIFH